MTRMQDLVTINARWLPYQVLKLMNRLRNPKTENEMSYDFFTDELSGEADMYYIDYSGRLIVNRIKMSVEETTELTGTPTTSLMFDIKHNQILFPQLQKVYAQINGKKCTLVLSFDDNGILHEVNSKIV